MSCIWCPFTSIVAVTIDLPSYTRRVTINARKCNERPGGIRGLPASPAIRKVLPIHQYRSSNYRYLQEPSYTRRVTINARKCNERPGGIRAYERPGGIRGQPDPAQLSPAMGRKVLAGHNLMKELHNKYNLDRNNGYERYRAL